MGKPEFSPAPSINVPETAGDISALMRRIEDRRWEQRNAGLVKDLRRAWDLLMADDGDFREAMQLIGKYCGRQLEDISALKPISLTRPPSSP